VQIAHGYDDILFIQEGPGTDVSQRKAPGTTSLQEEGITVGKN
jgi:hypothetical protein